MAKIWVLHGPNLNLLGHREKHLYGTKTLEDINLSLTQIASMHDLSCFQSNAEAELIELIHDAHAQAVDALLFNPAAFTHTSVALRDALLAVDIPFIEIHLSNVYQREPFRHHSYFSDIALGVIAGLGVASYTLALHHIIDYLES